MDEVGDELKAQGLPTVRNGEIATVTTVGLLFRQTRAASRYTEDTLLRDMEQAAKFVEDTQLAKSLKTGTSTGIGTAATRGETIESLKEDKYIVVKDKELRSTKKGRALILYLREYVPFLVDVAMTARWEALLAYVAEKGRGDRFMDSVKAEVETLVTRLRQAKPMSGLVTSPTRKEQSSMSDDTAGNSNQPSEKQINYARKIAERLKIDLPADVESSSTACSEFIDKHGQAASAPSQKQIDFAQRIAKTKEKTIPPDTLRDGKKLSAWIDKNK